MGKDILMPLACDWFNNGHETYEWPMELRGNGGRKENS